MIKIRTETSISERQNDFMEQSQEGVQEEIDWWAEYEAQNALEAKRLETFARIVRHEMGARGAMRLKSQYASANGSMIIHRSTRRGIDYQVSYFDDGGAVGHSNCGSLEEAIESSWEDFCPELKSALDALAK